VKDEQDYWSLTPVSCPENWLEADDETGLVSVIVPTYNRAEMLPTTLRSVWKQTYRPIEVHVVDDGSTDETPAVVRDWTKEHETEDFSVHFHRQENRGVGCARNRGLCRSRGEYIQFLDSDDRLSREKIEAQVSVLTGDQDAKPRVAFCETQFFREGDPHETATPTGRRFMPSCDDPAEWLTKLYGGDGRKGLVGIHAWLAPREIIKDAGPWRRALVCDDDGEYFTRVALAGSGIIRTDGCAYYRRHGGKRLSPRRTAADWRDQLVATRLKEEYLLEATEGKPKERSCVRSFVSRQYMQIAYQTYPTYPNMSKAAESWAKKRKQNPDIPDPKSMRARLARALLGWRGHRIVSNVFTR